MVASALPAILSTRLNKSAGSSVFSTEPGGRMSPSPLAMITILSPKNPLLATFATLSWRMRPASARTMLMVTYILVSSALAA